MRERRSQPGGVPLPGGSVARPANGARPRLPRRNPALSRFIPDLREGEVVVILQRQHWLILLRGLVWPILVLALWVATIPFAIPFIGGLNPDPYAPGGGVPAWLPVVLWLFYFGFAALTLLIGAYILLDWSDDWIALTTRRLIIMEKKLFLHESRREAPLQKVQNVTADYPNSIGIGLDFGNLKVDTAGIGMLEYNNLPHPRVMREAIFAQQQALKAHMPPPEDRRKVALRGILQGGGAALTPGGEGRIHVAATGAQPGASSYVSGYGSFNRLFPFSAQRGQGTVTWHKHWIFLVRGLLWPVLVYLLAIVALLVLATISSPEAANPLTGIALWVVLLLTPLCLLWALWNWEDWRNDTYMLDHERVYDIERLPFGLREQSKETLITRITDVTYVVPGPLANLFNFGNVVLKTPGEATEFIFSRIPCPREVQSEIMRRVDDYRLRDNAGADREIEAWLKAYDEVKREP